MIYGYRCLVCNTAFEVNKSVEEYLEKREESCPNCEGLATREYTETNFILKGDGWPGKELKEKS